ncbi:uncharacterized protein BDZ99DRAFT_565348 [Mytilinidion resinicola]|uniref:Small ribosomal subunit protein mS38 n=1 Tax=Mytilinidion resinicola TaxID=574789 RepID=A0A6A6ZA76_9PEZI|nr:uncharacterized protein BDZ99DRAFT_565348 [Mytilinidion resinicola]KAF2817633.1 hypothetical protein BDZ99DRAFT_565348 [Mytilinidion resinicola]
MFSPALGRAVRSTCAISAGPVCNARAATVASISAASQPFSRRPHQRRPSSSKASIPPDGANGSSSPQQTATTPAARSPGKKLAARGGRKRASPSLLNVPHVPPTDHLQQLDVKISSFFSLHRPISVTTPIPPTTTEASFGAIFEPRLLNNRNKFIDVLNTLSHGVETLEAAAYGNEESDLRAEILHHSASNSGDIMHLDELPQDKIDRMISQLIPFNPPPAPVPFGEAQAAKKVSSKDQSQDVATAQISKTKQKAWTTTVVVTESTDATGERTYSASTSPMVEIQVPEERSEQSSEVGIRQPFLHRMGIRERAYTQYLDDMASKKRGSFLLISTKRRRSLKMKKHKYKKLMKRTRLLRRKLDRT